MVHFGLNKIKLASSVRFSNLLYLLHGFVCVIWSLYICIYDYMNKIAVINMFVMGAFRTKFLNDDWMLERQFIDEQEHTSEKSSW